MALHHPRPEHHPHCHLFPVSILFIFLLVWRNVKHPVRKQSKPWYFAGIAVCVVFAIVSAILFSSAAKKVKNGEYDTKNPMTERILGMHFRYHTRICIYDGWRPPLHDPAMVIGMRLTGDKDPLEGMTLETRLQLYREVYPSLPVINECACSKESKEYHYFDDHLWKALRLKPMKVIKRVSVWRCGVSVESNNERLKDAGLPFSFTNTEFDYIVARLKDGSRVNIVLSPIAMDGDTVTIRKFSKTPMTVEKLIAYKSITNEIAMKLKIRHGTIQPP